MFLNESFGLIPSNDDGVVALIDSDACLPRANVIRVTFAHTCLHEDIEKVSVGW